MSSFLTKGSRYQLLLNMRYKLDAGFVRVPLWYEAMSRMPPPPLLGGDKPKELKFVHDRIRKQAVKKYPALADALIHNYVRAIGWYEHPLDRWVARQLRLEQSGVNAEEAFAKVDEMYQDDLMERRVQMEIGARLARKLGRPVHDPLELNEAYQQEFEAVEEIKRKDERRARALEIGALVDECRRRSTDGGVAKISRERLETIPLDEILDYVDEHPGDLRYFETASLVGLPANFDLEHEALRDLDFSKHVDNVPKAAAAFGEVVPTVEDFAIETLDDLSYNERKRYEERLAAEENSELGDNETPMQRMHATFDEALADPNRLETGVVRQHDRHMYGAKPPDSKRLEAFLQEDETRTGVAPSQFYASAMPLYRELRALNVDATKMSVSELESVIRKIADEGCDPAELDVPRVLTDEDLVRFDEEDDEEVLAQRSSSSRSPRHQRRNRRRK